MNPSKKSIPDRRGGGTFHYDKDGNFVEHIPPTEPAPAPVSTAEAPAESPPPAADESAASATGKKSRK